MQTLQDEDPRHAWKERMGKSGDLLISAWLVLLSRTALSVFSNEANPDGREKSSRHLCCQDNDNKSRPTGTQYFKFHCYMHTVVFRGQWEILESEVTPTGTQYFKFFCYKHTVVFRGPWEILESDVTPTGTQYFKFFCYKHSVVFRGPWEILESEVTPTGTQYFKFFCYKLTVVFRGPWEILKSEVTPTGVHRCLTVPWKLSIFRTVINQYFKRKVFVPNLTNPSKGTC